MATLTKKSEITPSLKIALENECLCCKYSPNKQFMVDGNTDGMIRIYESQTGRLVNSIARRIGNDKIPVTSIQFRQNIKPDDSNKNILSTYTDGKVILWNCENGNKVKEVVENRQTLGSVYHPKLQKFLTMGDNGEIYLYDEETMKLENTYARGAMTSINDGHSSRVFAAVFHPTQATEFVSGGWDSIVHFWDIRTPNSIRYIKGVHMCGEGLDISRNGRELMTCSYVRDKAFKLWHYETGRLMVNVEPDCLKPMLYCGKYLSPEHVVLGGTDPNLLRIVSMKNYTTAFYYKGNSTGVYSVDSCQLQQKITRRDTGLEVKVIFSIDKSLMEANMTL